MFMRSINRNAFNTFLDFKVSLNQFKLLSRIIYSLNTRNSIYTIAKEINIATTKRQD